MRAAFRVFHFLSYLAFRAGIGLIRLLSIDCAFVIGKAGGSIAYRILFNRRAVALANLRLAFGRELSKAELRALNRQHFQLVGANLLAGFKASTLSDERIWERITADIPPNRQETGWIALISHIGNWELYSHLGQKFPEYRFGAVYQTFANPFIDRYMRIDRAKAGITLFDRRSELLSCMRFLREGGVVGVLVDQGAGYSGLWSPLFGRLTSSSTLPARLAIRSGLPMVPLAMNTVGRARWRLTISEPVYPETDDPELLTAQINALLEKQIRRAPADWLWAHNRWKPLRPHFLLARNVRPVFFPQAFDRSTLDSFRILIVASGTTGEARQIHPAVRALRQGRPDTWLAVLATKGTAEAWKAAGLVDSILEWNETDSVRDIASSIRAAAQFDAAIFFDHTLKTALAIWLAKIKIRVGLRSAPNWWLYNQYPREPGRSLNPTELGLHIAQSVGADINLATPLVEQSSV
jgi:lauroyl/myristoyl acyltransferase